MSRFITVALVAFAFSANVAWAEVTVDLEKQLRLLERGERPELAIPGARNRVAVFTYEDPDGTGLGNALAAIVGREILLTSNVASIGVIRYAGGLSPVADESLSYFDKVERVTEAQQVTLAVWGVVRLVDDMLAIETFLQIPRQQLDRSFRWAIRLPAAMGRGELVAHLQPNRLLVQRVEVPRLTEAAYRTAAQALDELRAAPRGDAEVRATLPIESVYFIKEREGDWILVDAGPGRTGWVPVRGSCADPCASLLESARFSVGLLRYLDRRMVPEESSGLSEDALSLIDQIKMFEVVNSSSPGEIEAEWSSISGATRGAAFANLHAMARIAIELKRGVDAETRGSSHPVDVAYERISIDRARVLEMAFDLAEASQFAPANTDILNNLAILFEYGGDTRRADLARHLASGSD